MGRKSPKRRLSKILVIVLMAVSVLIILPVLILSMMGIISDWRSDRLQNKLSSFYDTTGLATDGALGEVVRYENLDVEVPGGIGYRILYRTEKADGAKTFSSGLVFSPYSPGEDKPVLAWAHGTLGLGDKCTPSRTADPADISWLSEAMANNWVVVATDYAGQGTPGTQAYLVGSAEAHDVINSVRAARNMSQTNAGNSYAVWGHSQGGNSALFTADMSAGYAPELDLKGTVASAPAAELVALMDQQYDNSVGWVIGSIVAKTWPSVNSSLDVNDVLSSSGLDSYKKIANQCIAKSAIGGMIRNWFKQQIFSVNPNSVPAWQQMAESQSAPKLGANQPLMVVESKTDSVVLPNTTALYIEQACATGSNLQSLWIDKGNHEVIPKLTYPQVIPWIADRFDGQPNQSNCNLPPAVTPYAG